MPLTRYLVRCGFVLAYVLALGLVLRFCARTYPGLYIPTSRFWNAILNGDLYTYGYLVALAAGGLHLAQLTALASGRAPPAWLSHLRNGLIAACLALAAFGLYIAYVLHRLSGMQDGA